MQERKGLGVYNVVIIGAGVLHMILVFAHLMVALPAHPALLHNFCKCFLIGSRNKSSWLAS
jgi:hypothetical protein